MITRRAINYVVACAIVAVYTCAVAAVAAVVYADTTYFVDVGITAVVVGFVVFVVTVVTHRYPTPPPAHTPQPLPLIP